MLGFSDIQKDQSLDFQEELFDDKGVKSKDLNNMGKANAAKPE